MYSPREFYSQFLDVLVENHNHPGITVIPELAIDEIWQIDLCDVQALSRYNKGYKYILTCINVFSKFAWARPLKNKRGKTILDAFRFIVNSDQKRAPIRVQSDEGKEFLNRDFQRFLKQKKIEFYTTSNETKASVVERFTRTLKTKL